MPDTCKTNLGLKPNRGTDFPFNHCCLFNGLKLVRFRNEEQKLEKAALTERYKSEPMQINVIKVKSGLKNSEWLLSCLEQSNAFH